MAIAFSDDGFGTQYGTSPTLNLPAVNVSTGDLIVVFGACMDNTADAYVTAISDTAGNSYTIRTEIIQGGTTLTCGYCINAIGHASNVLTLTFGTDTTSTRRSGTVAVFTPDSGETVSFDVAASGQDSSSSSPRQTGECTTTGTDELAIAGMSKNGAVAGSNFEIPSASAANLLTSTDMVHQAFYEIFTSAQTGLEAEFDATGYLTFCMELVCFKSEAPAGADIGFLVNKIRHRSYETLRRM